MGAFILAGILFILTCLATFVVMFAQGMSTTGTYNSLGTSAGAVFVGGCIITVFVLITHWVHIGW